MEVGQAVVGLPWKEEVRKKRNNESDDQVCFVVSQESVPE